MTGCPTCHNKGTTITERQETDGRTTIWAVACTCPAGRQWDHLYGTRPQPPEAA